MSEFNAEKVLEISEKLRLASENSIRLYDKGHNEGYDSGYDKGHADGRSLGRRESYVDGYNDGYDVGYSEGHDAGRDDGYEDGYGEGHDAGRGEGYEDGYGEGYNAGYAPGYSTGKAEGVEEGKKAEYDAFWDAYQNNGRRANYQYAFRSGYGFNCWGKTNFKPKYDIIPTGTDVAMSIFENFGRDGEGAVNMVTLFQGLGITLDTSKAKGNFGQAFRGDGVSRWGVIDLSQATNTHNIFYGNGNPKLTRIDKIVCSASTPWVNNSFQNQSQLTYIRFEGVIGNTINFQWQTKLDRESIDSVIWVLSPTASGKTLTLSKTAVNKAYETSEGANDGSNSSEWLERLDVSQNWTITLV